MNLAAFATPATPATSKSGEDTRTPVPVVVAFIEALQEQGLRVAYGAVHAVRYGRTTRGTPTYAAVLDALPLQMQYCICKKGGGYSAVATAKWREVSPPGSERRPVLQAENALAAFSAWRGVADASAPQVKEEVDDLPSGIELDI